MQTSLLTILLLMDPNFLLVFIPVVAKLYFQELEIPINICEDIYDEGSMRNLIKINGKTGAGTLTLSRANDG